MFFMFSRSISFSLLPLPLFLFRVRTNPILFLYFPSPLCQGRAKLSCLFPIKVLTLFIYCTDIELLTLNIFCFLSFFLYIFHLHNFALSSTSLFLYLAPLLVFSFYISLFYPLLLFLSFHHRCSLFPSIVKET